MTEYHLMHTCEQNQMENSELDKEKRVKFVRNIMYIN